MKWLSKLEFKYRRYAIENLAMYIAVVNMAVFLIVMLLFNGNASLAIQSLGLFHGKILSGEIWRLITFIFLPESYSLFWVVLSLYLFYMIGTAIESYWGKFRFNVYYLLGMIGAIVAAFITGGGVTGFYLNMSLFLAYATLYPEQQLMVFFVIPVKVKYLGVIQVVFVLYQLAMSIQYGDWAMVGAILASFVNYFIFFGSDINRLIRLKLQVSKNRKRFFGQVPPYDRDRNRRGQ